MIGQDAVNAAKTFDEALDITGVMLTKLDGVPGRCGSLYQGGHRQSPSNLWVWAKLDQVELFYPMASRILGMGDVLSLIEKAKQTFDAKKSRRVGAEAPQEQVYPG